MTIAERKERKRELGYSIKTLSELSGVPAATIQKIFAGATAAPRRETILRLEQVLADRKPDTPMNSLETEPHKSGTDENVAGISPVGLSVREATEPAYKAGGNAPKKQGEYTLEDYLALPDEQRVELIDGVFYDMGAPTTPHQIIGGTVHAKLLDFIFGKKGTCLPFIAPTDVQLDRDNRTIVQPDVMIVCDRSKITTQRIFGAPDFVMEVLSPGTKTKDIFVKTGKYKNAGVREYWIVDVKHETVTKFLFLKPDEEYTDGDTVIRTYGFSEPVPVTVLNEEISIDFSEIAEIYSFLKG